MRPIDGEMAAPEIETADSGLTSRRRPFDGASVLCSLFQTFWNDRIRVSRCSYSTVLIDPTSGPPTLWGENTKLVTLRPGGVYPRSDTFADAQINSSGQSSGCNSDSVDSSVAATGATVTPPSSIWRLSAKTVRSRRL